MEGIEQTPAAPNGIHRERPSITVAKPIPYTFDLGNLTVFDANIIPSNPSNDDIAVISRDCAQALINQILTTCTIHNTSKDGTLIKLPPCTTPLPREKALPAEKQESKWERFAKKKGITKSKEASSKMVYDEEKKEWIPRYGYKGKNKGAEGQWLVEIDEKKEAGLKDGETIRGLGRRERVENVRRNERKQRANDRKDRKQGT